MEIKGLSGSQIFIKRTFDLLASFILLLCFCWLIFLAWLIARLDTGKSGFFKQKRVGQYGRLFNVYKIRTMKEVQGMSSTVTAGNDVRITRAGGFFRKAKIDELPQLFNVLIGNMTFVGPRPDVPGFADKLTGEDEIILTVKPGITGPASIAYRNEEEILSNVEDPEKYNTEVIWPDKVNINKEYIKNYSFFRDIKYIFKTVFG